MKITQALLDTLTEQAKVSPRLRMNMDLRNSDADQSQRMLNAIEPGSVVPKHRHQKTSETMFCLRGRLQIEFYDELERRCTEAIELRPGGPVVALNIPIGQWHTVRALESGTVIMEVKDGLYEDYYAVYQMVACIAKYKRELDGVAFQTQLEDTFVDDLLIAHPDMNVYHQLKNTKELSWTTKPSGTRTVASDFEKQIEDCEERDEKFALKLVYSAVDSDVAENVPETISKYTTAEYFPYQDDLNSLLMISREFKAALKQISAKGNDASDDELLDIATVFLGVWKSVGGKEKVRLSDIVERAENVKHFNLAIHPTKVLSPECKVVLDAIEGLEYSVNGRMLYWSIGLMSGSYPLDEDVQKRIISRNPKTKKEFITLF